MDPEAAHEKKKKKKRRRLFVQVYQHNTPQTDWDTGMKQISS